MQKPLCLILCLLAFFMIVAAPVKALPAVIPPKPDEAEVNLGQLSLTGDFTIRYQVVTKDLTSLEQRTASAKAAIPWLTNLESQNANQGRPVRPGQPVPPEVRKKVAQDVERLIKPSNHSMIVTLSEHGGKFLYLLMVNPHDADALKTNELFAQAVLFDGKQSLWHPLNKDEATHKNMASCVWQGLDTGDMNSMPVFCADTAAFPLIVGLTSIGDGVYQGNVLDPGNSVDKSCNLYDPTTQVSLSYVQGKPRITQIVRRDPNGTVSRKMEVTDWFLFKGIWIPAKAKLTHTMFNPAGKRVPSHMLEWALIDAKATAEASRFETKSYLQKGDMVEFRVGTPPPTKKARSTK